MTAYALVRGAPTLGGLNDDVMSDRQVLDMASRIEIEETLPDNPGHPVAVLTLECADGKANSFRFSPDDLRMDAASVKLKYFDCFQYAGAQHVAEAAWDAAIGGHVEKAVRLSAG